MHLCITEKLLKFSENLFFEACVSPFQSCAAFRIETSHLFCSAKQMTRFYIKWNSGLKWVNRQVRI